MDRLGIIIMKLLKSCHNNNKEIKVYLISFCCHGMNARRVYCFLGLKALTENQNAVKLSKPLNTIRPTIHDGYMVYKHACMHIAI